METVRANRANSLRPTGSKTPGGEKAMSFQNSRTPLAGGSPVGRFEVALDRVIYRALDELQRLRAFRAGQTVAPPVVVDLDVAPPAASNPTERQVPHGHGFALHD